MTTEEFERALTDNGYEYEFNRILEWHDEDNKILLDEDGGARIGYSYYVSANIFGYPAGVELQTTKEGLESMENADYFIQCIKAQFEYFKEKNNV